MCPATESSGEPEFFRLGFQADIFAKHGDSLHAKLCCICNKVLHGVRGPGSPSHQCFRPPRDIHATPSRRKQLFGSQPRMNTESQIPKRARGWSAIRRRIADWPKPALIALVKDLHDASPENRDFLPARSERGASSRPMSLSCWKWPETMREPLAKVSVAREEENSYGSLARTRWPRADAPSPPPPSWTARASSATRTAGWWATTRARRSSRTYGLHRMPSVTLEPRVYQHTRPRHPASPPICVPSVERLPPVLSRHLAVTTWPFGYGWRHPSPSGTFHPDRTGPCRAHERGHPVREALAANGGVGSVRVLADRISALLAPPACATG